MKKNILTILIFLVLFLQKNEAQNYNRAISFNPQRVAFNQLSSKIPLKLLFSYKQKVSKDKNLWINGSFFNYSYRTNVFRLGKDEVSIFADSFYRKVTYVKAKSFGLRLGLTKHFEHKNTWFFEYGIDAALMKMRYQETYDENPFNPRDGLDVFANIFSMEGTNKGDAFNKTLFALIPHLSLGFKLSPRIWLEIPLELQCNFEKNNQNNLNIFIFKSSMPILFNYYF